MRHTLALPALAALVIGSATVASAADDLAAELAAIVDAPAGSARVKLVKALASRDGMTVAALSRAARSFGTFEKVLAGIDRAEVTVDAGDRPAALVIDYFVPEAYDPEKPTPLLLSLHASGADGTLGPRRWESVADQLGMIVISPHEPSTPDGALFTRRERLISLGALRWARRRFNVDENRIHVTGISRGGHLAWDLALRFPDRFAAMAPMIGGPRWNIAGGQNNLRYLENVAALPIRDLQGLKDHPGLIFNLNHAFEHLAKLGARDARFITFPELGHSFEFGAVDWTQFFGGAMREAVPERVVRLVARKDENRAFWVEAVKLDRSVQETFTIKVDARRLAGLDTDGQRRLRIEAADRRTGRVEATMSKPGVFVVRTKRVKKVRLLLSAEMFTEGEPVEVSYNGRKIRRNPKPDRAVLLTEFGERFDRTFIPVAAITVP